MKTLKNFFRALWSVFASQPGICLAWFLFVFVIVWTVQSTLQKNILGLDSVESVCWGAKLQLGYFKHPPLAAWLAFFGAKLTNWSDWVQYFLDIASSAVGVWFVFMLGREFFSKARAALSALLLFSCHYYIFPTTVFCPNSIMMALLPVMALYFYRSVKNGRLSDWCIFGAASGAAFLGKYAAGLLLVAMFASMLFRGDWRKRIISPGPWIAFVIFAIIISPHVLWLYQNDFVCLTYVGASVDKATPSYISCYPLFLLGTAVYPLAAMFAVLTLGCLPDIRRAEKIPVNREAAYYSAMLTALPVLILLAISCTGRHIVATWFSTLALLMGILVVSVFPFAVSRKTFRRLFVLLCAAAVIVVIASSITLAVKSREKLHVNPSDLICEVNAYQKSVSAGKVSYICGQRWLANVLENYMPDHPVSIDREDPVTIRRMRDAMNTSGVLLVEQFDCEMDGLVTRFAPDMRSGWRKQAWEDCVEYKAPNGKKKKYVFYMLYLPPGKVTETVK